MNENDVLTFTTQFAEGDRVRYISGSRVPQFGDKVGVVKAVRLDEDDRPFSLGVWFGNYDYTSEDYSDLVWAHVRCWRKLPALMAQDFDVDKLFTEAAGGPLAVAKAELDRLKARVAELENAIKVIESL